MRTTTMSLWIAWWDAIWLLRPAFSRLRTFMWFAITVAGLTVRTDSLGVTSIVRALKLRPRLYNKLLDHFHSDAVQLDRLSALWTQAALRLFPQPLRVNGRRVLVGDGIKVAKCGKKMPGVKLLHQQSESNTKPEYIMGHSLQAVSMLVHAANSVLAVPLAVRIHEGLIWSNRDRRTLLDKMLSLLGIVAIKDPFYFVGDAFYAARKLAKGLYDQNNHLVSRVKSNAVAFAPYVPLGPRKRGRLIRFVAVVHPSRGSCLLMCTDISLDAIEIIRLYGLRFKIEHSFKQAVHRIGSFAYHFWMRDMKPLRRGAGNQYLHRESLDYRNAIKRKILAYHVFIQAGVVCQGLLHYLAVAFPSLVWSSFGSWLRTIRPGVPPSELVVASALRQGLPEFLLNNAESNFLAKFIVERQDPDELEMFRLAT